MLLGVDAGGTSSRAVLADATGRCVGYGMAGGGNPVSWGPELAARAVGQAVARAMATARDRGALPRGAGDLRLGSVVLAMAGGSGWASSDPIDAELRALGLTGTVTVESDLLATYCAGTAAPDGYALIAGTGSAAIRVRGGRVDTSADGLGWLLGDEGSGFWIGWRVVRESLAALDNRGPQTRLVDLLLTALGLNRDQRWDRGRPAVLQEAIDALYRMRPVELSRFAALAFQSAGAGGDGAAGGRPDEVAVGILREATRRLLETLAAVRAPGLDGPVVLGGGVAHRLPGLAAAIADAFRSPTGPPDVVTVADGALGAAVLALRHGGVQVDGPIFDRLATTLAALRA
jgi:N-acetylglucosamine kinase-like BadF-type ATPase